MQYVQQIGLILALVLGFGFVVFFHELGHFLAAKWVGIKVEQFAVGFGHAILAWRKGLGVRVGTTTPEYETRIRKYLAEHEKELSGARNEVERVNAAAQALGLSETEYRWNWIPLGGYVKMLGQDDMNPNAQSEDPRAYNRKSIGARMIVVSAGVIMNVILALIFFAGLFLYGYKVPPAVVGGTQTNSPAQLARLERIDGSADKALLAREGDGLRPGDEILEFDRSRQYSFVKLSLDVALVRAGQPIPMKVRRGDRTLEFSLIPEKPENTSKSFYAIGILPPLDLKGPDPKLVERAGPDKVTFDKAHELLPGEVVTAINGQSVTVESSATMDPKVEARYEAALALFDKAVQNSHGKPVRLTVKGPQGERTVDAQVRFQSWFGNQKSFNLAGLEPAPAIVSLSDLVKDKLKEGDVVVAVTINNETLSRGLTLDGFRKQVAQAGKDEKAIGITVERDGQRVAIPGIVPNVKLPNKEMGLGVGLDVSAQRPLVASVVEKSSMAAVPAGSLITRINDKPTETWFDVHAALVASGPQASVTYQELDDQGNPRGKANTVQVTLTPDDQRSLARIQYASTALRVDRSIVRQTDNPLIAAKWGMEETRDLLLQFYVTLLRLTQGSVSATNFMGPLGIAKAGYVFAERGGDWLIWFLAMISANLAVVNFLPIPIVDGGLFMFLILEKIQGKPLSPRMQVIAQYVGLAIIVSVFLMVTYQDIVR